MTTLAHAGTGSLPTAPAPARRRSVESGSLVSIGDAARLIGVSPSALRLWERQGLVDPSRTAGGERRYGPAELDRLREVVRFRRGEGLNAPAIRRLLATRATDHPAGIEDEVSGAQGGEPAPVGLGARLRGLRASRGLSIRAAAGATGLSASSISALERGLSGASLAALRRLVEAYGATLGELLRDTAAPAARHVRADERRVLDAGGGIRIEDLAMTPSILESQLFVLAPGASSDGAYSHPGEEFMYVLAGSLGVWLDEKEWYQLATGDTLTFPSTLPHRFSNLGPVEARVIWINTPPTFLGGPKMLDTRPAGPADAGSPAPLPDRSVIPPVWARITNIGVDRGEGSWLVTPDGERYLDYSSGIGVTSTGHAHPRVAAAVAAQAAKLLHGQQNIVYHEPGLRLYERLRHVMPGEGWSAFLSNSGAEAVEASVKLARVATGRPVIVAFRYGFHGRTGQTMALTAAKDVYRAAFEPLPGSVYHTAYPYCYRAPGGPHSPDACTCDWEEQLDLLFHQFIYPEKVAAIICEPVMGEGGYIVPPPGFWPRLREITSRHGILLIADEVQTGFGRTGRFFAVQHWDVTPDILVMAKGIASGLPLSGILAQRSLLERLAPGTHGGTYGGNVVSCAAALATLDVIEEEGLVANARERGAQFLAGLRRIAPRHRTIGDVRGLGLMLALEFVRPDEGDGRVPDPDLAKRVIAEALSRRLIVLSAGTYANVVRIIPPLVTTADEVDLGLSILAESLAAAGA